MSEYSNRYLALSLACEHAGEADVVEQAGKFLAFFDNEVKTGEGKDTAPKKKRGKTAAAADASPATTAPVVQAAATAPASAPETASDDLFGETASAPVTTKKEKPATIEDVRAALVEAQTVLGGKDAVIALL